MTNNQQSRSCPFCKEDIKADAIKCRYCSSSLPPTRPAHKGVCPYCREKIHAEALKCKHCLSHLGPGMETANGSACAAETDVVAAFARWGIGTRPPVSGGELSCAFAYIDCMEKGILSPLMCRALQTACIVTEKTKTVVKDKV